MNKLNPKTLTLKKVSPEDSQNSISVEDELRRHLNCTLGHDSHSSNPDFDRNYFYRAAALTVRDQLSGPWRSTRQLLAQTKNRQVHYLSLEFLLGRSLNNAVQNLELSKTIRAGLHQLGVKLEEVVEEELDAGLGNGGLGRLAACFLDSCANLELPVTGYGIRYEYGMFHQKIEDGHQVEAPDHWLRDGNPWEIERAEDAKKIGLYGHTEKVLKPDGTMGSRWVGTQDLLAVPYDMPIPGFQNNTVNATTLESRSDRCV